MADNKSKAQNELEPLEEVVDTANIQKQRVDMREISKASIKAEHHHLMYLLEQNSQYFMDADVTELKDSYQIHYQISEHTIPFDNIKNFAKNEKLRYLLNISKLQDISNTRYTFNLSADELYFTKDGLPLVKTRGLKNVVAPLALSEEEFLTRYKALVITAFNQKTSFEALVEGNLALHKGTPFEKKIIEANTLQQLTVLLNEQYDKQQKDYTQNFAYVRKTRYTVFKWIAISVGVVAIGLLALLAYMYFSVMKMNDQVEKGYQAYVKADYTQVLNKYKDLNGKHLDKEALYIYATSYIQTNKQGLEKEKKENLLNNITPNSNKDYLLYWVELGQGHLDEALNIATYLDDNDIMKLALINKLSDIKNNPDLSNDKRSEATKKYNDKLQDILDREKDVKDEKAKKQEQEDQKKDKKLKQQEENEKKQKEQEQKDKEKRQKAERNN
ncbi:type VII secretion protein EssB [Staphylococcus arlettae]|nr:MULTISPECIES: type VII secretion protein EssB [Staphylococcus]PTG42419.1 type VII secretion protein EssB [Staphylococcus cohnii]MCE7782230.1 type VII secretion protein EssB [Staphylococcus xylosus]PTH21166.1 type VII secretion protein EssB [Staphylococcus arlettae]PTH25171.1 type VII secretion protein EssB [Staphylococcus arlettae]PTH34719.1 type VII secretion protein EssB [Staphylococcus arlettae]